MATGYLQMCHRSFSIEPYNYLSRKIFQFKLKLATCAIIVFYGQANTSMRQQINNLIIIMQPPRFYNLYCLLHADQTRMILYYSDFLGVKSLIQDDLVACKILERK